MRDICLVIFLITWGKHGYVMLNGIYCLYTSGTRLSFNSLVLVCWENHGTIADGFSKQATPRLTTGG